MNEDNFNQIFFLSIGKFFLEDEAKEIAYILDLSIEDARKEVRRFNFKKKVDNQLFSLWLEKKSRLN